MDHEDFVYYKDKDQCIKSCGYKVNLKGGGISSNFVVPAGLFFFQQMLPTNDYNEENSGTISEDLYSRLLDLCTTQKKPPKKTKKNLTRKKKKI